MILVGEWDPVSEEVRRPIRLDGIDAERYGLAVPLTAAGGRIAERRVPEALPHAEPHRNAAEFLRRRDPRQHELQRLHHRRDGGAGALIRARER